MTKEKKLAKQGEKRRFNAPKDAFVALGPHYNRVGQIVDIDKDGLEFRYMAGKAPSGKSFELDIFLSDGDFYLEKVPCKTVSDVKTHASPYAPLNMRQCAVQFVELSPDQRSQLEYFIRNCTPGEVIV
jgi:hypothetical protein